MFLSDIAQTGRLAIAHPEQDPPDLAELLEQDVAAREAAHRLERVSPAPEFRPDVGRWAATMLYRCCQFLLYRDIPADVVTQTLSQESPAPPDPAVCYSADVAFCYLPDVYHLARGIAPEDPLVVGLRQITAAWPLSSVGINDLPEMDIAPFFGDPCLRELYVTRILERRDRSRLRPAAVRTALHAAWGAYPELAPEIVTALAKELSP